MNSLEIRKRFIDYFSKQLKSRNLEHIEIPSSSLVPEQHPTLLFTNSGMVQLTPYFLGEKDPVKDFGSKRLVDTQKSLRTGDLDKVGISKYHLTFFEMLGSWSIGDYGKKEAVQIAFDLLTNKDYGFGMDPTIFIPTVFGGNDEVPFDAETFEAWRSVGIPEERISKLPVSENWWTVGGYDEPGPCGPCTEILIDRGPEFGPEEDTPGLTDNPRYLEIWNAGVFMEYFRDESGKLQKLPNLNVDTGAGLERFAVLLQGVNSVYETDLFAPIIGKIKSLSESDIKPEYLWMVNRAADHLRASSFIISEMIYPSNKDQGYVLRRLLRTVFDDFKYKLNIDPKDIPQIIEVISDKYKEHYLELANKKHINDAIIDELDKYEQVYKQARHVIKKNYVNKHIDIEAFDLYQSTGASLDLIKQVADDIKAQENIDIKVVDTDFDEKLAEHQEKSKLGAGKKFKGGLEGHSDDEVKLHTATHLLHNALRKVLGEEVQQMGSNITPERLRFDFSYPDKLTDDQLKEVEDMVNIVINESKPVQQVILPKEEAEKTGALHFFKEKYGDSVSIYFVGDTLETAWSKEFCGGPHVKNTSEIGGIKIIKEEGIGKGVRRIKAVLVLHGIQ